MHISILYKVKYEFKKLFSSLFNVILTSYHTGELD